jgi:hypothetical protein
MSKNLSIGPGLSISLDFVTKAHAIIARRRRGKSYTASVIAEEMLEHHQQIGVIDPTGAWYGLKSSADGKSAGYPIVVFGGDHQDAPLEWRAGRQMAQAFIAQGFSAIFDISNMDTEEQIGFVNDFAREMLKTNREAVHLFVDEADTFAPQLTESKMHKVCLGSMSRLVKQGGIRGIGVTLITQRSADLNKKLLSQVEVMTALTISHPPDMVPVSDWISSNIGKEEAAKATEILPTLPVGTILFCLPGHGMKTVGVRQRRTFNSGATPKPGERRVEPKVLASVDIEKLGKDIAASVQEARDNSVDALKEKVRTLETKLAAKGTNDMGFLEEAQRTHAKVEQLTNDNQRLASEVATAQQEIATSRHHTAVAVSSLASIKSVIEEAERRLQEAGVPSIPAGAARIPPPTARPIPTSSHPVAPAAPVAPRPVSGPSTAPKMAESQEPSDLPPVCRRILEVYARLAAMGIRQPSRRFVCVLSGYSNVRSTGFEKALGQLKVGGLVTHSGDLTMLTQEGIAKAPRVSSPLSNAELHDRIMEAISPVAGRILVLLLKSYPQGISKETLCELTGYSNVRSTGFEKALGELSGKGFIRRGDPIVATDLCFVGGY